MPQPKLSKLELAILQILWKQGALSIREIQEGFPEKDRPAYTTIQTTIYRMEGKKAVRRVRKISNAHIFEATVTQQSAQRTLIDDLLALFGGRSQPVVAQLIDAGKLTMEDIREAERLLSAKEKAE